MLDTYDIIRVLRLTQARHFDAACNLLYHNPARSIGLCESQQPHSAIDRAFCVPSEAIMIKQCPVCNTEFKVKASHAAIRRHCSRACQAIAQRESLKGENNPNYRNRTRQCLACGKSFPAYGNRKYYCSRKCRYGEPKIKKYVQLSFVSNLGFRECKCMICGKRFYYHRSGKKYCLKCKIKGGYYKQCKTCGAVFHTRDKRDVFCGMKCYALDTAERQRGERSHHWKGGLTRPDRLLRNSYQYADWRKAIFERDDYTCQLCFERGGKLAAHHIREYAKHPDIRIHPGNGITLCWPCHRSVKGKERAYETAFYDITGGL